MLPEVEKLLRVQHHDQRIKSIEKELEGVPLEVEDLKARLAAKQEEAEAARAKMQQSELAIKNLELDVGTRRSTIGKLKVQQFETRKNEEYQRMGLEIERYTKEIVELEDRQIELMETLEQQKEVVEEAREQVKEEEESINDDLNDLETLTAKLKADREEEIGRRDSLSEQVDSDVLDNYRRLFKSKNGRAIVGLVDGVCQGCHMKVIKSTMIEVKAENRLTHCENCGRILYWWTDEEEGGKRSDY